MNYNIFNNTSCGGPFVPSWLSQVDESLFPYVPPCERNPWYDDPRDVKPTTTDKIDQAAEAINEGFKTNATNPFNVDPDLLQKLQDDVYNRAKETTDEHIEQAILNSTASDMSGTTQSMRQCAKCGTWFVPDAQMIFGVPNPEYLCHECRGR